uniref:Reverse transcriptase domain-containing protein n=1 Tax=Podarcis muralis TaxID=64176 RepID=A0A670JKF7_PODMU
MRRTSKDHRVNEAGVLLYQMAIRLNLVPLNGTCLPDIPGDFTHLSVKSNSVLDYLLVSSDLLKCISTFKIENVQSSDHLPLVAKLSLNWQSEAHRHATQMVTNESLQVRGIKWSETQAQRYQEFFQKEILGPHPNIGSASDKHSIVLKRFHHHTTDLTSFFRLPPKILNRNEYTYGAPWYNSQCKQARQRLRAIYNVYKTSDASTLPASYAQAKQVYKRTQKIAKREWQHNRWQALITASKPHRSREFWSLINRRGRKYPRAVIPAPTWELFLKKCFSQADAPSDHLMHLFTHLPIWPPTDPDEIAKLIAQLKPGKAPGPDLIPAEAIKLHPKWWAGILAKTFDAINASGLIPKIWKEAIIVPIHKKGSPMEPENYRNISLLLIIGKIYDSFLLTKLLRWVDETNQIDHEQAGFRIKRSTTDHAIVLYHLARKYSSPPRGYLCAAFLDLKAAFDSVPRNILWEKLAKQGIDRRLLWLISQLHEGTLARVRLTPAGDLTNSIPINKGVRQGCILAPCLFNLFISDMRAPLVNSSPSTHAPRLADYRCPLLLYADDAVILSYTRVGLTRALKIFATYCQLNQLTINHVKSKILIFARSRRLYEWKLGGAKIEQVLKFQYLGVIFQYNLGWKAQIQHLLNKAKTLSYALLRFFFSDGALHVPSALKVFKAKVVAVLAYAAPLWAVMTDLAPLETLQNQFLRRLLMLPLCVSNAAMRLELKIASLETCLWKQVFNYWLSLWHRLPDHYLVQCLWRDEFSSLWTSRIHAKLLSYGISPSDSLKLDQITAQRLISQRLDDIDLQRNYTLGGGVCSPQNIGITLTYCVPSYLSSLSTVAHRLAFTKARFNVFPSNVLRHRFSKGQASAMCECDKETPESLQHIMFTCPLFNVPRANLLGSIIQKLEGTPPKFHLAQILQDKDTHTTLKVARFLVAVLTQKRRQGALQAN